MLHGSEILGDDADHQPVVVFPDSKDLDLLCRIDAVAPPAAKGKIPLETFPAEFRWKSFAVPQRCLYLVFDGAALAIRSRAGG